MARWARITAFLALLIPFSSLALAGEGNAERIKERAKKMAAKMEKLRGLDFKFEVEVGVKTEKELLEFLLDAVEEEMPDAKIQAIQKAYVKMGLLPEGLDLKKTFLDMLTSQVGGFYNPKTKRLYIIDRKGKKGKPKDPQAAMMDGMLKMFDLSMDDIITAHELTHALQDQHFDLQRLEALAAGNDDRMAAIKCVFEGDATVAMWEPLIEKMPLMRGMLKRMENMDEAAPPMGPELKDVPNVLKVPLAFPYIGGVKLVNRVKKKGGWEAVNELFKDPPTSTEQILHLEKYFEDRDDPVFIRFRNVKKVAPEGWKLLESNSLGELGTRILVDEFLSTKKAKKAAAGWDGDRFAAYESGDDVFFFWFSTWDDEKEAREFASAYVAVLKEKYGLEGEAPPLGDGKDSLYTLSSKGEHARLAVRGCDVVVIEGLEPGDAADLEGKLFRDVRRSGPAPPLPGPPLPGKTEAVEGPGFSVKPPQGWSVRREKKFGRVIMEAPRSLARLEVGTLPRAAGRTPADLAIAFQEALPDRLSRYRFLGKTQTDFQGEEACILKYEGEDPLSGLLFCYSMTIVVKNGRAVVITFAAPEAIARKVGRRVEETLKKGFRLG